MALVECPECKKQISDKARHCINCGVEFSAQRCKECGSLLVVDSEECIVCGCLTKKGEKIDSKHQLELALIEQYELSNGNRVKFINGIRKTKKCSLTEAENIANEYYERNGIKYNTISSADKIFFYFVTMFFSFLGFLGIIGGSELLLIFSLAMVIFAFVNYNSKKFKPNSKEEKVKYYNCPYCGSDHIEAYIEQTQHAAVTSTAYVANPFIPMMHKIEEKVEDEYTTSKVRYICKSCNQIF